MMWKMFLKKPTVKAVGTVFSSTGDDVYEEDFPKKEGDHVFSVEFLPGSLTRERLCCTVSPAS